MKTSSSEAIEVSSVMTYKLSPTDLVSVCEFINRSVHAGLQVSVYSGYDLCHPG